MSNYVGLPNKTTRNELHLCRRILSENTKEKTRETIEFLSANALHTQRE